ncbi:MAG: ATP-binding protein [Candidatus Pacebacteria bacterium]|nr:ATP-binding protein [Candidatus Paceibacterota bacterium]
MSKFKQYLKFPEIRVVWLFVFLTITVLLLDIKFLKDPFGLFASAVALAAIGILIFFTSIATVNANLTVKQERNRLNTIISNIADGVIVYDKNFKIMVFNKAAEKIFVLPAAKIIGKSISVSDVKIPEFKALTQIIYPTLSPSIIRRPESTEAVQVVDIAFEEPLLNLRISTTQLIDEEGSVFGFLKIVRDRTRETELLKSKSDFITIAAHQLRTPLTAVTWALESLKQEPMTENQKDLTDTALGASNNLLKVIEDLLSASTIEEGKFGYTFEHIDLVQFLKVILNEAQLVARKYKVNLFFQPPDESMIVYVDQKNLVSAVSNILDNAIKYNIPNGQVTVGVSKLKGKPYVQIDITDTGIGISGDDMKNLFSKFFRSSKVMTKETTGSGLGLYITRNIIRRHGGDIWAESVEGRGTTFHIVLPTDEKLVPHQDAD